MLKEQYLGRHGTATGKRIDFDMAVFQGRQKSRQGPSTLGLCDLGMSPNLGFLRLYITGLSGGRDDACQAGACGDLIGPGQQRPTTILLKREHLSQSVSGKFHLCSHSGQKPWSSPSSLSLSHPYNHALCKSCHFGHEVDSESGPHWCRLWKLTSL